MINKLGFILIFFLLLKADTVFAQVQCYCGAPKILYAPTADDNPAWRAEIENVLNATVDYYDPRVSTPPLENLLTYCAVITWVNDSYADKVLIGDVLADYVDAGGQVILGNFSTFTMGNFISGRIMDPGYSPVASPLGTATASSSSWSGDGTVELFTGISSLVSFSQDKLLMQGAGIIDGTYLNGEVLGAYRDDYAVFYLNGMAGRNFIPGVMLGDWDVLVKNAVRSFCPLPIPTVSQWGLLILALILSVLGTVYIGINTQNKNLCNN